jgi:hypothetical protein
MNTGLRLTPQCLPGGLGKHATVLSRRLASEEGLDNRKQWKPGLIRLRAGFPSRLYRRALGGGSLLGSPPLSFP